MTRKYKIIQDPLNGNRYQARVKNGDLPWGDVGEAKETREEAEVAIAESREYWKRVAEGGEPTTEVEDD